MLPLTVDLEDPILNFFFIIKFDVTCTLFFCHKKRNSEKHKQGRPGMRFFSSGNERIHRDNQELKRIPTLQVTGPAEV